MTKSQMVRKHVTPLQPCKICGFTPIFCSYFDIVKRVKRFAIECPNENCPSSPGVMDNSKRGAAENWNEINL